MIRRSAIVGLLRELVSYHYLYPPYIDLSVALSEDVSGCGYDGWPNTNSRRSDYLIHIVNYQR